MRPILLGPCVLLPILWAGCAEPLPSPPPSTSQAANPHEVLPAGTEPLPSPPPSAKDFSLQAIPVEALEGGPVVLQLVLTYQGDEDVNVVPPLKTAPDACTLAVPKGWERPEPCGIASGMVGLLGDGYIPVRKGDQFVTTVYMHEKFTRIPSGRASLKVNWWVSFTGNRKQRGREEAVTTTVDFDVPPATPENLAAVQRRIEAAMDQPTLTEDAKWGLARRILDTKHRAFLPTVLRMLDSGDPDFLEYSLIRFAYANTDEPEALHAHFIHLVTEKHEGLVGSLFEYWQKERVKVPDQELSKLMKADSIWVRALTYATFGKRCDEARVKATLRELGELQKPMAAEPFARLLAELDDDDFATRERASRTLESLGERVKGQLRSSLSKPLSLEAKKRVERLLAQMEDLDSPLYSRYCEGVPVLVAEALDDMRTLPTPEAQEVLEAVAQGDPDSAITQLARTCLAERAKKALPKP